MRRVLAETPGGRNAFEGAHTKRVYALFAKTRAFDGPATDPLVLGVLDEMLGHYQLSGPTGIEIGPGEVAQVLHHDDAIYPWPAPTTRWCSTPCGRSTTSPRPTGPRASSRQPSVGGRAARARYTPTVAAEMPAGSVLFYLGTLWHGGGANTTDRARLGVILEYVASWVRPQENHFLAVPPAIVRTLPERLQELLGYNIRPPFMGYVDGRHPRRVLDTEAD